MAADESVDAAKLPAARPASRPGRRRAGARVGSTSAPAEDVVDAAPTLRSKRLVVARGVERREPVGVAKSFRASKVQEITAFVELTNDSREASAVRFRFEPPEGESFEVRLDVGAAPRWRTWATTKKTLELGTWSVRVLDAAGTTIARTKFEVTE